jgi:hypothetical protein
MPVEQLALFEAPAGPPYVYAGWRNGLVKIGTSVNPAARARRLGFELLGSTPGGREVEAAIHARFAGDRVQYEWFAPTARVWAWVAGLSVRYRPPSPAIGPEAA